MTMAYVVFAFSGSTRQARPWVPAAPLLAAVSTAPLPTMLVRPINLAKIFSQSFEAEANLSGLAFPQPSIEGHFYWRARPVSDTDFNGFHTSSGASSLKHS
ncbi:hypothetical protein [Edaphobacter modestus]|uniref:hypothetical protein n=1 Tax=Edaphobacter modestus TaxID=388466 RepID=UPI0013EEC2D2|nr:hypothetical protein [Edaphobacter modestus]